MELRHTLSGRGASPGTAMGVAILVRSLAECASVGPEHIMVVTATTPDHVAAMRKSAGVIAETGSIVSHAAVVSREMNKPCAVSVEGAMALIHDGDQVSLDGGSGEIKVFEPEEEAVTPAERPLRASETPFYYRRGGD